MELNDRLKQYRLSLEEYEFMKKLLKREPRGVEWALFSALWSEHCSYKSSKTHLKKLFNQSKRVLESFGENAGVIDLGQGERVAFKMESHNHPSFIEPYQGAATGVGGILRDIFTMGARPIALADYLCFGEIDAPRMKTLVDGVVRGIGGYGNCVGVPTITGQTEFHSSYNNNILVNALALGLFRPGEPVVNSKARGAGNYVVYVGAKTGRDGIHGASMASESFDEKSSAKKPTVQIGDPFYEKLLIESCLEVIQRDLVVAIQDMGAAGLTSSSFEMAAKGGVGFSIHLDKVPLRDSSMTPEDILLSESQERMLLVCEPRQFSNIHAVFENWGLDACVIGEVTAECRVKLYWHSELLTDLDPRLLTDEIPHKNRPYSPWQAKNRVTFEQLASPAMGDWVDSLRTRMQDLRATSRSWVYGQYDQRVGTKTALDCESSIGVVRLPDSGRGLGLVTGCRPYVMRFDAREGGLDSVLEPALQLASKGFTPLALTDCLNFGNPERPEIMTEFVAALDGLNEAARELDAPIISGNVSFYNETLGQNITSTPATGLVGLRSSVDKIPAGRFAHVGDHIFLLSKKMLETTGLASETRSQAMRGFGGIEVKGAAELIKALLEIEANGGLMASRVVGKFGLPYALVRMCTEHLGAKLNADVQLNWTEVFYQVVLVGSASHKERWARIAQSHDLKFQEIGEVQTDRLEWDGHGAVSTKDLLSLYNRGLEAHLV